jgi:hypothetical protein
MEWFGKIGDFLKLPTKYFGLVAIVTGAVLLLPEKILERLHIDKIPPPYGTILGIVFLMSIGLVVVNSLSWMAARFQRYRQISQRREFLRESVNKLDDAERAVLREFFLHGQTTIQLPFDHPVIAGMMTCGILQPVGRFGRHSRAGMMFSFRISDSADEFITSDVLGLTQYLTDGPEGKWMISEQGIEWIERNRPPFI